MYNRESFELSPASLASPLLPLHPASTYNSSLSSCRHPCAQDPFPNSFAYHSYAKTWGVGVVAIISAQLQGFAGKVGPTVVPQNLRRAALVHCPYIPDFAYLHSFQLIPRCTFKTPGWGSHNFRSTLAIGASTSASPLFAILSQTTFAKSFACHSYAKTG